MHAALEDVYSILETGNSISAEQAKKLAKLDGEDILDLVSLANKVRNRFAGNIESCSIVNARSGVCRENCRFCSQSVHHESQVERYGLMSEGKIIEEARTAHKNGVSHFGIVTSGYGYPEPTPEFKAICRAITRIHDEFPEMEVCTSLGILGEETVAMLAASKIGHYNINLQVTPRRYAELIADTHTIEDRISTIRLLRKHGISVCCGAIFGVGESVHDRIELAYALQELDISVIPLNVLIPIKGTPLQNKKTLDASEVAKSFALFRLIHPRKIIKFAAGRETLMKDFQGLLMLAGMNGLLTGGYLTTRGRDTEEDRSLIAHLDGFQG